MLVFYPLHQSHSGRQSRDISKCSCELAEYRLARSKYINKTGMNRMEQCNITVYLSKLFKVFIKRFLIKCMLFFFLYSYDKLNYFFYKLAFQKILLKIQNLYLNQVRVYLWLLARRKFIELIVIEKIRICIWRAILDQIHMHDKFNI